MDKTTSRDLQPKQIMVVEDEFVNAMELQQKLIDLGYEVPAIVASGEEAVRKASELLPDLILMDITLDGPMSGIEAADEIRKRHPIPIIYLTAHADTETIAKAKATEPFGYLPKPHSIATLMTMLEVTLYKSEADAARRKAEDELKRLRDEYEEALRKSEEKYRTVADFTYDWEFWLGPDGNFIYCSPSCQRITGHSAATFQEDPTLLRALVHPDDLAAYDQHCQAVKDQEIVQEFEFRIIRANGSIQWAWIAHTCQPIFDDKGQFLGSRGSNRDVSVRKRLEAEVIKDKNLASLGTLAGGIAHDFNNLFQGLLGNISLAMMNTEESSPAFPFLKKAEQVHNSAIKLTSKIIAFSKGGSSLLMNIHPSSLIREAAAATLEGSDQVAEFDVPDSLWPINADPAQFRDVIKHMMRNALEALPAESNGKVKIMAVNESLQESHEKHPTLTPGNYVKISIQDQGCGISREHLPRIFDPYFSTKALGPQKGMGLGLALCDTIIKKCCGAITVESKPDQGTTFHIYIPAVVSAAEKTETTKDLETHGSRILLMDDDLVVIEVTTKYLKLSGYRVDSTLDGDAAITAYTKALEVGDPYALVILDLMIPGGMGGIETIAILKKIDPEVKAIVSSGYAGEHAITNFAEYGFTAACAKPCLLSEMKATIERFVCNAHGQATTTYQRLRS